MVSRFKMAEFEETQQRIIVAAPPLLAEIVVPVFNEEACIGNVLEDLSHVGNGEAFEIGAIRVISDASTDGTHQIILRAAEADTRIRLTEKEERRGKTDSVNLAIAGSDADVLVFIDADVRLGQSGVIEQLLKPFTDGSNTVLVQGNLLRSQRRISRSLVKQASQFDSLLVAAIRRRKPVSWWSIDGRVIAMRREFYKDLVLPRDMAEDQFLFYTCHQQGKKSAWVEDALFFYGPPETLADFSHQWSRYFFYTRRSLQRFGKQIVARDMAVPGLWRLIFSMILRYPLAGLSWLACFGLSKTEYLLGLKFDEYERGLYRTASKPV
jgi:cellulose synthase/poly-beta-1,6-N-acetylglucosamine synthase-like glycosyltransferase